MNFLRKSKNLTLVLGGTGKTGRRVAERLKSKGHEVRVGSRSAVPSFDWDNEKGWDAALKDVTAVYITYAPDLAMPGAPDAIQAFVDLAKRRGVKCLVLLSGRGEEEAQACERIVQSCRSRMDNCPGKLVQPELLRRRLHRHGAWRYDHAACRQSG